MKNQDSAVSPVIGVMLMLIVTLVVAAVVSGFAGGLIGGANQKAPNLAMDIKVSNTGTWIGSGFSATVTGVSEPIQTKDLKIVTSWRTKFSNGTSVSGGKTVLANVPNVVCYVGMKTNMVLNNNTAPYGFGPGVSDPQDLTNYPNKQTQWFGNYSLVQGTGLAALPYGTTSGAAAGGSPGASDTSGYGVVTAYTYTGAAGDHYVIGEQTDPTQAVLGSNWENLKAGDVVTVKVVHVPTGKTIFQKDVAVTEG
jgi:FlaG/FlaF family flagellin (archaellin)